MQTALTPPRCLRSSDPAERVIARVCLSVPAMLLCPVHSNQITLREVGPPLLHLAQSSSCSPVT